MPVCSAPYPLLFVGVKRLFLIDSTRKKRKENEKNTSSKEEEEEEIYIAEMEAKNLHAYSLELDRQILAN